MTSVKDKPEITSELIKWFDTELKITITHATEDLIKAGKVDSYSMLLLFNYATTKYNIPDELDDFEYNSIRSLDNFVDMIIKFGGDKT